MKQRFSRIRLVYKRSSTLTKVLVLVAVIFSTVTLLGLRSLILQTEAQNAALLAQAGRLEEENAVVLHTALGTLVIQGRELKLKTLSLEGGQMAVDGKISAMSYEEPRVAGNWLHRLFG